MDKLVYTASTGMRAHMAAQTAIANNMANASTIGFRADRVVFDRIDLKGGGAAFEARMPTAEVTDADRAPGTIQHTGNALDIAIATSSAWLAVQAPTVRKPIPVAATWRSRPRACCRPATAIRWSARTARSRCRRTIR